MVVVVADWWWRRWWRIGGGGGGSGSGGGGGVSAASSLCPPPVSRKKSLNVRSWRDAPPFTRITNGEILSVWVFSRVVYKRQSGEFACDVFAE